MNRYNQLLPLIQHLKPTKIVEVGTWNGLRAIMMATEALKHQKAVHYTGYDLFENATDATDAAELNVKARVPEKETRARLDEFKAANRGFTYKLIVGNTRVTLHGKTVTADLAFIDGGHSLETIKGDYTALKSCRAVVLDDFYQKDAAGKLPDTTKFGCNTLIETIEAMVLPAADPVKDGGLVHMAVAPPRCWPGKVSLVIKTRNCVSSAKIQGNIKYASTFFDKWIVETDKHDGVAVIISGGPTFKDHFKEIAALSKIENHYIFCVKTSHDVLIEKGVVPFGCFLLDPRPHVLDFISNPHPSVRYFCATMCHPVTIDRLVDAGATIFGYNAHVGAGEQEVILKEGKSRLLIPGGSTAATRAVSVAFAMGFRRAILYGYDSCYASPQDKVHGVKKDKPIFDVTVAGRTFHTDAELLAQAQDFDKLLRVPSQFLLQDVVSLDVRGAGMIPHVWSVARKVLPTFKDVYCGGKDWLTTTSIQSTETSLPSLTRKRSRKSARKRTRNSKPTRTAAATG